jgi:hypothetical protein
MQWQVSPCREHLALCTGNYDLTRSQYLEFTIPQSELQGSSARWILQERVAKE